MQKESSDTAGGGGVSEDQENLRLKAHVIHEIFDTRTVRGVDRNVLFLSNLQAEVCTTSPEHLQRLLDQFPMPRKPKMVINLCVSKGLGEHVNSCKKFWHDLYPGLEHGKTPFTAEDTESKALEKLDCFMADVIIPLAVETNALIFCAGISKMCALSSSLSRVVAAHRHSWSQDLPFTTIYTTSHLVQLLASEYKEGNKRTERLFWRELAAVCKPWQKRISFFETAFCKRQEQKVKLPDMQFDLDERAVNFLIVDSLAADGTNSGLLGQCGPYNNLLTQLVSLLWRSLPVLAIKTGGGDTWYVPKIWGPECRPQDMITLSLMNPQQKNLFFWKAPRVVFWMSFQFPTWIYQLLAGTS